jgi:hypothetical protein
MRQKPKTLLFLVLPLILGAGPQGGDISIHGGNFCGDGLPLEAERSVDRLFAEAEEIASRTQTCPVACRPRINQAEFCAYGHQLAFGDVAFSNIASDAVTAGLLFDTAIMSNQSVLTVVAEQLELFGGEAITVLHEAEVAVENVRGGRTSPLPDETCWHLVARDIADLSGALTLLQSVDLTSGNITLLTERLDGVVSVFDEERDSLHKAVAGAAVLDPAEAERLLARFIGAKAALTDAIVQLTRSSELAHTRLELAVSTEASANPAPTTHAASYQEASACLTKLSLTLMTGREALLESKRMLQDCRPFNECPLTPMPKTFSLEGTLGRDDEAAKQSVSVSSSMCE